MPHPGRAGRIGRSFRVLASTALLSALACIAAQPARAIIHGAAVAENDPYAHAVVGLALIDKEGHQGACTGVLLTPRAVLTAAHCITAAVKGVSVVFDLKIGATNRAAVTRTVINPDFNDAEKISPGDLAIVFLAPHDRPTAIMPLDSDGRFTEGQQFVFLGYGRSIRDLFKSAGVLRKAAIAATGYDTPTAVVMKPLSDAWPCSGDSGGPVFRKDLSGHYAISGIMTAVRTGPGGECLFDAALVTPVHTYASWIAQTLAAGG